LEVIILLVVDVAVGSSLYSSNLSLVYRSSRQQEVASRKKNENGILSTKIQIYQMVSRFKR
jgi:hypothetical protein